LNLDNDEIVEGVAKKRKVSYETTQKFQFNYVTCLPWVECVKGEDGLVDFVKCQVYNIIDKQNKILMPKWDMFKKLVDNVMWKET
jgi:hypothetical protein